MPSLRELNLQLLYPKSIPSLVNTPQAIYNQGPIALHDHALAWSRAAGAHRAEARADQGREAAEMLLGLAAKPGAAEAPPVPCAASSVPNVLQQPVYWPQNHPHSHNVPLRAPETKDQVMEEGSAKPDGFRWLKFHYMEKQERKRRWKK